MTTKMTRRTAIRLGATGIISIPVAALGLGERAMAADLVMVKEDDSAAKALGYVEDATKIDATKYPAHKPDQNCATCRQYKGDAVSGQCALFPKKLVNAGGWCKVWAAK